MTRWIQSRGGGFSLNRGFILLILDKKTLPKADRKRLQIEHAAHASDKARLVKLADKLSNLRDVANSPPSDWELERRQAYYDWAKEVIDQVRGVHPKLEQVF